MGIDTFLGWMGGLVVGLGILLLGGSIGYCTARRWRTALVLGIGFGASLVIGIVAMPVLALVLVEGKGSAGSPEEKARVLAECISEVMNCGAWLALPAFLLGFWLFRSRALKV